MDSRVRKSVAIVSGILLVMSIFLPAMNFGYQPTSMWNLGLFSGNPGGIGIVALTFAILALVSALQEKYENVQVCSMGVFTIALSLVVDLFVAKATECIDLGLVLIIFFSIVGIVVKELKIR